ncbi:hypothetical protein KO481_03890 [Nocardia sp. NEAU-G5]|uniref:Uncharacterized protein n=1 Tax=Nocardia albiluteola TaxID=2842303 RepID=A0ABS6ARK7_9NOCA|nr:hypothetical protein [Nocardia albiluteola]MBU3060662.1 hypothetical protein [Nocardia albiluteola]
MKDKSSGQATQRLYRHTTADSIPRRPIRLAAFGIGPADRGKDTIS